MGTRLYVGNLAYSTTEDGLRQAFADGGRKVTSVFIATDRETGRPRGFAFVEMESADDAKAAIAALDGQMLDGRPLRVNEAQERPRRSGPGRDRDGGDRGGFRGGNDRPDRGAGAPAMEMPRDDRGRRRRFDEDDRRGGGGRRRRGQDDGDENRGGRDFDE